MTAKPDRHLQSIAEIEAVYELPDPWGYETNPHDHSRKAILLAQVSNCSPERTLDIGCGHGFVTRDLPGKTVVGVDVSSAAIGYARSAGSSRHEYHQASLFELTPERFGEFDLIVITGLLYRHYIGEALPLVYLLADELLHPGGMLITVHIDEWYRARFPFRLVNTEIYRYREYLHRLEVYVK